MLKEIIQDKTLKAKQKTERLAEMLLQQELDADTLTGYAAGAPDTEKAICIEALEFATARQPGLLSINSFRFVTGQLSAKAPRVKWESAKVIANTAHLFSNSLGGVIKALLINTEHSGTVVRWSAATALAAILVLKTPHKKALTKAIEAILAREENNGIRKIYLAALKKDKANL